MVNIDYTDYFIYPKCLDNPDVIIMDGITMRTCKESPQAHFQFDDDQQHPQIPQSARLFIATTKLRKQLQTVHNLPTRSLVEVEPMSQDFFTYFPAFKKNYK
ncbi:hypothetical protein LOD99_6070 [Oopsacas minuta]|uniref:Uncharacterized protein n=1 Tax=Oopsacas minuta TaxID=111878 RepID=A0AAV7JN67_9METZ|nr:hypothetical protein LOD99_6070 [Oopsacas minuta]